MLYYKRIDLGEGIDIFKNKNSEEYIVCHYCHCNHGFKLQRPIWNGCHVLPMLCLNTSNITIKNIINFKGIDYRCIIHDISKSDAVHLLEDSVLDDFGYTYSKMHIK